MNKTRRLDIYFLLGLLLGIPAGIYGVHHKFIDNEKAVGMWSEESTVDDFAKKEFIHADLQHARDALNYAIKVHQDMQAANPAWGATEQMDLGWCYSELSIIEESAGNTMPAKNFMAQAVQTLRAAGIKDISETRIRQALQVRPDAAPPADANQPPGDNPPPGDKQPAGDKQSPGDGQP